MGPQLPPSLLPQIRFWELVGVGGEESVTGDQGPSGKSGPGRRVREQGKAGQGTAFPTAGRGGEPRRRRLQGCLTALEKTLQVSAASGASTSLSPTSESAGWPGEAQLCRSLIRLPPGAASQPAGAFPGQGPKPPRARPAAPGKRAPSSLGSAHTPPAQASHRLSRESRSRDTYLPLWKEFQSLRAQGLEICRRIKQSITQPQPRTTGSSPVLVHQTCLNRALL